MPARAFNLRCLFDILWKLNLSPDNQEVKGELKSADCVPILEMGYSGGNDVDGLRISYIVGELVKGCFRLVD